MHIGSLPLSVVASLAPRGQSIKYLLREDFISDAASVAGTRPCEPGPGTLTFTDSGNKWSIAGGYLMMNGTVSQPGDPRLASEAFARVVGRCCLFNHRHTQYTGCGYIGWSDTAGVSYYYHKISASRDTANVYACVSSGGSPATGSTYVTNVDTNYAVVLRSAGAFMLQQVGSAWKLIWVDAAGNKTPLYFHVSNQAGLVGRIGSIHLFDLGSPWDSDYGVATNRVAAPTSPTATTSTADAIVEFTWTPAANEVLELDVRRTDADNRWVVRCDQAGGTIKLIECNAGNETERSSAAQTWTVGTARRIVVIMDGGVIRSAVADVDKNVYTSATFNATATGVQASGFTTGSNLVCWPCIVSPAIPTNDLAGDLVGNAFTYLSANGVD